MLNESGGTENLMNLIETTSETFKVFRGEQRTQGLARSRQNLRFGEMYILIKKQRKLFIAKEKRKLQITKDIEKTVNR